MSERTTLICAPIDLTTTDLIGGSIMGACSACSGDVWVSPSGQSILANEKDAEVLCVPCGVKRLEDPEAKLQRPTPEQLAEVRAHYKGKEPPVW